MPGQNPTGALRSLPVVPASCLSDHHISPDHFSPHLLLSSYLLSGQCSHLLPGPPVSTPTICSPHAARWGLCTAKGSEFICGFISLRVKAGSPSEPHQMWHHQPPDLGARYSPFHTLPQPHSHLRTFAAADPSALPQFASLPGEDDTQRQGMQTVETRQPGLPAWAA